MKNPFTEFRGVAYRKKEMPLERIVRAKAEIMDRLTQGYLRLAADEVQDLVWLVEHSRVVKVYGAAVRSIRDLTYDQDDLEEFLAELGGSREIAFMISGPAEIYLSALVNHSPEEEIVLGLREYRRIFHFLGYRLPAGKTLVLKGDAGDFIGAALAGGRLVVEGSVGNWCGAGMTAGEIVVSGRAGENTGEWMQGGEIHVADRVRRVGQNRPGGRVYQGGELLAPGEGEGNS